MAVTVAVEPRYHVVLGGSGGIGFAYAKWLAAKREPLIVVARRSDTLQAAGERLRRAGALRVDCIAGDVTKPGFRAGLLSQLRTQRICSVFIGGPSPAWGSADELSPEALAAGYQICINYPFEIVRGLQGAPGRQTIVLLSSSATREPLHGHPFYLSAVLRRSAEQLLHDVASIAGNDLVILRPGFTWTDLAARYASSLFIDHQGDDAREMLASRFGLASIPDADDYIASELHRLRQVLQCNDVPTVFS